MVILEVEHLSFAYRPERPLFYDVSFAFEQGQVLSILGANGAGKSTLLNLLAGELAPDAGAVETGETVRVGYFRQEVPDMDGDTRVIDYVKEIGNRIETGEGMLTASQLLEQFLFPAEAQWSPIRKLSGGEKRRLFLLSVLAAAPNVLLLDEPMNGLDPEGVREMRNLIIRLNEQRGITVVVSSHVLDQLGRIATRYGVIDAGRMVCEMTANEVTQACGDYLVVRTAEPERTLALLAEAYPGIACTVLPDGTLRLRGVSEERAALDATVFGTFLAANNIPVYELRVHERDLEDYFLELMGGDAAHV